MGDVTSWSKTPASNSNADPSINWAEGQPKNTINDSARAMMAAIAQFRDDENGIITTGGTANNFTVALSQSITAYNKGLSFLVAADRSNPSASPTMTVGGLATIEWRKAGGVSWAAGEIIAGSLHRIVYNAAAEKFESAAFWPHAHAPADLQAQAPGTILANITAGPGSSPPAAVSLSLALDALMGTSPGLVVQRGATEWIGGSALPPGVVIPFAGSSAPLGWLECNGTAVSRTDYAALFIAIGTTYGAGDASTTFNVPDLRGEFIRGWDNGRGIDTGRARGSAQADAFQGHRHSIKLTPNISVAPGALGPYTTGTEQSNYVTDPITDGTNGTPRTAAETRPRNIAMMYIVKV